MFSLVTAASLVWALWTLFDLSFRGFDTTDEAYYVLSASRPSDIEVTATLFGFYTGALLQLAHGDVVALRATGILILALAGALFSYISVQRLTEFLGCELAPIIRFAAVMTLVIGFLSFYSTTLITPSYNWLNFMGVTIALSGWLTALGETAWRRFGLIVAGLGVGISLMAKPPSGLLLGLALALAIWLSTQGRWGPRLASIGLVFTGASVLFVVHFIWFQSPAQVFAVISRGLEATALLGAHDRVVLVLDFVKSFGDLAQKVWQQYGFFYLVLPGLLGAVAFTVQRWRYRGALLAFLVILLCTVGIGDAFREEVFKAGVRYDLNLLPNILGMALMLGLGALVLSRLDAFGAANLDRRLMLVLIGVLLIPAVYAFGTGNKQPIFHGRSALGPLYLLCFAPLFFLLIRYQATRLAVFPLALLSLALAWRLTTVGERPYRLAAPMAEQVVPVEIGKPATTFLMDPRTASAWREFKAKSQQAGFVPGSGVLDLTGFSPGLIYGLGGSFVGVPWYLGGYPGSMDFVRYALNASSHPDIRSAWLLTAEDSKLGLEAGKVLPAYGRSFPDDYARVLEMTWPQSNQVISLWRPLAANAE